MGKVIRPTPEQRAEMAAFIDEREPGLLDELGIPRIDVNMFRKAEGIEEVIAQAVGAGSVCWVGGTGSLEFDSQSASEVVVHATMRISEIIGGI